MQYLYRATVGVNFAVLIITFAPSTPPGYRGTLMIINTTFQNAMACRVFRQVKTGNQKETSISSPNSALPFTSAKFNPTPSPRPRIQIYQQTAQYISTEDDSDKSRPGDEVDLTKQDIIHLRSLEDIEVGHDMNSSTKRVLSCT